MSVIIHAKAPPPVADINVTPMVDVMLVLLIIFMVITPMLSKGVSVDMVKTQNPISMQAADKSDAITIAVSHRDQNPGADANCDRGSEPDAECVPHSDDVGRGGG